MYIGNGDEVRRKGDRTRSERQEAKKKRRE
jgi:hypothetical protein